MSAAETFRSSVQAAIDANRQDASKWKQLYEWFDTNLAVGKDRVGPKLLTQNKQLSNRIRKELAELDPTYVLLVSLPADFNEDNVLANLNSAHLPRVRCALLLEKTFPQRLVVYERDEVVDFLEGMFPGIHVEEKLRAAPTVTLGGGSSGGAVVLPAAGDASVDLDPRVRRMLKLAVATSPAVILVGPPGTGKTTLVRELVEDAKAHPEAYGLSASPKTPMWVTPNESWTATDLIGGDTVAPNGQLQFRPGSVLDSIADDRWLILDEANRADMDKIFGGLLTWLSGQTVEVGRVATNVGAPQVMLGWSDTPDCEVENLAAIGADDPVGDPVRFAAGTEWRLIGTYNAVDAQRVFRFGQAVGRRFAHVPIPPPDAKRFSVALDAVSTSIPEAVRNAIVSLYSAHLEDPITELGPAVFLRVPVYIAAGLSVDEAADPGTELSVELPPEYTPPEGGPDGPAESLPEPGQSASRSAGREMQLLSEAYLVNVGPYLARLEQSDLDHLEARLVARDGIFSKPEFDWIIDNARHFT